MKGQPFFFDENIFDDDSPADETVEDIVDPLAYTQGELENAKTAAFEDGRAQGIADAEQGKIQDIVRSLKDIGARVHALSEAERERITLYETEAAHLTYSVLLKLFPILQSAFENDVLRDIILKVIQENRNIPNIEVRTSFALETSLTALLPDDMALPDGVRFTQDTHSSRGVCQVLWSDGGVVCDRGKIAQEIFTLIEQRLAQRGIDVHDSNTGTDARESQTDDQQEPKE